MKLLKIFVLLLFAGVGVLPIGFPSSVASEVSAAPPAEAPTGFMVIKRHVFLAMMKHYPELNYVPDGPPNNPQAHLHWRFFDCMVDPDSGRYLSEDYAFCRRWRAIGGEIWLDQTSRLTHTGPYSFVGNAASRFGAKE